MAMTGLSRLAPLPLRLAAGATLCHSGYQKLFVAQFEEWSATVATFGFPQADLIAHIMAWGMLAGGALLILGFVARLSALLNAATMFVIIWKTKLGTDLIAGLKENLAGPTGYQFELMLLATCLCILLCGAGSLSVDSMLVGRRSASRTTDEVG